MAYVVCAAAAYAAWWHKPKDMNTPITIYLPYDRESNEMPSRVRRILDAKKSLWMHSPPAQEDSEHIAKWKVILKHIAEAVASVSSIEFPRL